MDPNQHHGPFSRMGGIGDDSSRSAEFGTVIAAQPDRYTHTVRTERGRALHGVPRKRSTPSDVAVLPVGTTVVVRYDLPLPYIDGCLTLPAVPPEGQGIPVGGGNNADTFNVSTQFSTGSYRGPSEPTDLMPGDHVLANTSGVRVGALEGGVAVLSASQYAQVRAHLLGDLVEVFSRNYRHLTDMGVFKIQNDAGRINMSFRGASDQLNEAAPDEENWTIKMDLGAEGDLFNFELTTPNGQSLFRMHVDSNGRCEIFGLDGVVLQSGARNGEAHREDHGGDVARTTQGNVVESAEGDTTSSVGGNASGSVGGNATLSVGTDLATQAVRDVGVSAGRNMRLSAAGDRLGSNALTIDCQGGHCAITVGTPSYPTATYDVSTLKGDMTFTSTLGGNHTIRTPLGTHRVDATKCVFNTQSPDSVILGGTSAVAHVVRYEQLVNVLGALLNMLATHIHPHTNGPTGTSTTPFTSLRQSFLSMKSVKVAVGG